MSSVHPSVTLVDQDNIAWKSWKLSARIISPTPSLFVTQRPNPRRTWGYFGETRGRVGKSGNISGTRKDRRKVTLEGL